ncbi:MAG: aldehyde dehydrogenase [Candidatus Raymondbacteria bacterium RifOxyA12_full_50_37]|uniref:Aldehyde dehydrogenase n=1 Tax=Candidatus Raymondbacteria bacterium RIFOXYD12_FULL_49_13 TaxID=1817890 RepID=A0A1F7FCR6_UNCRA|nr:MAG: aldehyde dehydrogenase [Candidatus Raymondbacteria bacterium RifOxyA12_full_50_37]OGJ87131.1 MAG: aldehyde dehydrogenase [Candidatus Raymondbacteria bacterium RIFOXYA2_FULL_49_16]OGJ94807.1 MAG: aldehyde dehydrogenase [Candidatus Raymondbacteria bacterium RifOxyB12_full_50_8]OGJ96526.1 MAG: aldehyde dehydrogenase [Candidatus Raymondbacteria bacterium RIFOXYC2_FULL_50_21]OGK04480.1 MAG: aldehyde dehydrogenase [Candidatus Raymondbacteria bacterium RIFOXYD12_FULL_49_13]OGP40955.1 MAG: ald
MDIKSQFQVQHAFHLQGETRLLPFRQDSLKQFETVLRKREPDILDALAKDLSRPAFEAYAADLGIVLHEIKHALSNLESWSAPIKTRTPLVSFPSRSFVIPEPFGICLIISPWNFPFLLSLCPLVGAVAAGNCVMIKPSSQAPHSSQCIKRIVDETFEPRHVTVVQAGREEGGALLNLPFNKIFFTGSPDSAKIILKAAANNLTPVTLELGGKNPCIVDDSADISLSAKRISWGKFFNAGQSCVAPDYIAAHSSIKEELVLALKDWITRFFGADPKESKDFGRIVNDRQYQRLSALLNRGNLRTGGQHDEVQRYLAPTVIDNVTWVDPVMQQEIFGPLLPVLEFTDFKQLIEDLKTRPKSLGLYLFSKNKKSQDIVINSLGFGGGCINDVMFQFIGPHLPFGGVGSSGMGRYHGKASFDAFSHHKSILRNHFFFDIPLRYAPYGKKLSILKRVLG